MAELKVTPIQPGAISFNYEELKTEIVAKAQEYAAAVYTADNIGFAKADRAKLNKLKTALNEERLKREREFMKPFAEFKEQIADLIKIIDEPIKAIDTQVKAFEENERLDKKGDCIEVFASIPHPEWLDYEQIENPKWYNKTTSLASVKDEIAKRVMEIESDLNILADVSADALTSLEYYKRTLNLKEALDEGKRAYEISLKREAMKQMAEPKADIPETDEEAEWVSFRAFLTPTQAKALSGFCKLNGIKLEKGE